MSDNIPIPPDDETEAERLFREDQDAVAAALADVMAERGLEEGDLAALLLGEVFHYRAIAYVLATAKPSETGFRQDLDRLRKEAEEIHREYRKNAGGIVKDIVAALAEAEAAVEEEPAPETIVPRSVISDGSGR